MKVGITAKLFLFVLLACAAVVVVQGAAIRFVMERGFLGYLNQQSRMRMEEVVPRMEEAYAARGGWDFLRSDFREWMDLVLPFLREPGVDPAPRVASSDQTGAVARMGLLDANVRRVVGNPDVNASSIRIPVVVEGRTVGWVAMVPFEAVLPKDDERFLEQQFKALTMVGLGSAAISWRPMKVASPPRRRRWAGSASPSSCRWFQCERYLPRGLPAGADAPCDGCRCQGPSRCSP